MKVLLLELTFILAIYVRSASSCIACTRAPTICKLWEHASMLGARPDAWKNDPTTEFKSKDRMITQKEAKNTNYPTAVVMEITADIWLHLNVCRIV